MNHFSYRLTLVQINIVEDPQNIFFPILIPDPILSSQPSHILTPRSLLVANAEDNSLPGDLTIIFSNSLISCMRLHVYPVMQNWFPTCLKCQMLLTAGVVSWLPPTTIGSGFFFLYELSLPWLYILLLQYFVCSNYFNVFEVWISIWSCLNQCFLCRQIGV